MEKVYGLWTGKHNIVSCPVSENNWPRGEAKRKHFTVVDIWKICRKGRQLDYRCLLFIFSRFYWYPIKKNGISCNIMEINEGDSFTEESIGTNAVALAMRLKKAVYILPQHHYCDFLKKYYFYAVPLWDDAKEPKYLAAAFRNQSIEKEMALNAQLMAYQLANELELIRNNHQKYIKNNAGLSTKQIEVLKLLATGITDKALSLELGISLGTVKYHKSNIFERLHSSCSIEAVVKAIKLNIISLDDITV